MFFEKNYKYQGMYWLKKAAAHGHIVANWGLKLLSNCDCNCFDLKEFEASLEKDEFSDELPNESNL